MTVPKVTDFNFTDSYRAMIERERMQVSRDEAAVWSEDGAPPDHPVEILLDFGCNVRQTPHLQREAVAVLQVLGVEFAAVAGQKKHYISVLADALGVSKPDRFSEYWRLGDPAKVMEASRPNWSSWGITEDEALRLAHKYFTPNYGVDIPDCPCNGACSATGSDWLNINERQPKDGVM